MICSDIDGVILWNLHNRADFRPRMNPFYEKDIPTGLGYVDEGVTYITGRKECYRITTAIKFNELFGFAPVVYHFPKGVDKNKHSFLGFKTEVINQLRPDFYIDDDMGFVVNARALCPDTPIIGITITPTKEMACMKPANASELKISHVVIDVDGIEHQVPRKMYKKLDEYIIAVLNERI